MGTVILTALYFSARDVSLTFFLPFLWEGVSMAHWVPLAPTLCFHRGVFQVSLREIQSQGSHYLPRLIMRRNMGSASGELGCNM